MNKVFILLAVVLLCALILSYMFFIGNLGDFAQLIGQESSNALGDEYSTFIGLWEISEGDSPLGYSDTLRLSLDKMCNVGGLTGVWDVEGGILVLDLEENILSFEYAFSNDDQTLTLIDFENGEIYTYERNSPQT